MCKIIFAPLLFFVVFSCQSIKKEKADLEGKNTIYYFIRHAEKDRTDLKNKDPELTEIGIQRAKKWADYFDNIDLDLIYSTNYKRTRQT